MLLESSQFMWKHYDMHVYTFKVTRFNFMGNLDQSAFVWCVLFWLLWSFQVGHECQYEHILLIYSKHNWDIEFIFKDVLLNVLKRLNTKSIDTQLCVTFDFGSVFHAELEDTKVTSVMHFFGINFFVIYGS